MAGVNKVILLGNLGADPEVRALPSGVKVANINIATSESYTGKDGQRVDQTEWHRIELWDNLANIAEQYLKKGNQVYIEGKIRSEEWQDKNGATAPNIDRSGAGSPNASPSLANCTATSSQRTARPN